MKDLINEEEFLPKKSNYNPWKIFKVFYAIAFGELLLVIIVASLLGDDYDTLMALICVFMPSFTAMVMFFYKKENALLSYMTIVYGVTLLLSIFYIPIITILLLEDFNLAVTISAVLLFNIALCLAILFPVSWAKKKDQLK